MNRNRWITCLVIVALLGGIGLSTDPQQAYAATQIQSGTAIAISVGVSSATGHVFVVSTYAEQRAGAGPQQSWVAMLDSRTYRLLRVTPIARGATQILISDRTGRAFVVHAYGPRSPTSVTVLDTRTGKVLRRAPCGQGLLFDALIAPQAGRLFLATSRLGSLSPPFKLHVLDTATGKHVRLFALSWAHAKGGMKWTSASLLSVLDTRTGSLVAATRIPVVSDAKLALDSGTGKVFVTGNGNSVTVLDTRTGVILHRIALAGKS
jgi:DNA-binding beta-propeller fold protein YncE